MIDRNDLKCPACGGISLKQECMQPANGRDTTRKERELNGLIADDIQTLICRPRDSTWYGCIMCNTEFDGDGNIYSVRKMYPFSRSTDGELS